MSKYVTVESDDGFLGKGTFGIVEKVVRQADGQVFACKTIRFANGEKHQAPAHREYSILSRLDHPNIVKYIDIFWMPTITKIYMSFCEGGSLADFISRRTNPRDQVSEPYIFAVFYQLSSALFYCHNGIIIDPAGSFSSFSLDWNPVLHRDIKPGNILLSTGEETEAVVVKLGDFGLSTFVDDEKAPSTYAGTKEYLAPEINRYRQGPNHWTKMCDIFSLGCTIYELSSLQPPFRGHMEDNDSYKPLPSQYSAKLNNRVANCMSYSPERRPDAFDLVRSVKPYKLASNPSQIPATQLPVPIPTNSIENLADDQTSMLPIGTSPASNKDLQQTMLPVNSNPYPPSPPQSNEVISYSQLAGVASDFGSPSQKPSQSDDANFKNQSVLTPEPSLRQNQPLPSYLVDHLSSNLVSQPREPSRQEPNYQNKLGNHTNPQQKSVLTDKEYTYYDVSKHSSKNDLFVAIHKKVYNVTSFLDEHPGGEEVLLDVAGLDASEAFEDVGHSDEAREILYGLLVGKIGNVLPGKEYTYSDVSKHNSKNDLFVVIHDKVYNVTSFLDEHPGGEEVLLDVAGLDASEAFEDVGHSDEAREILETLLMGKIASEDKGKAMYTIYPRIKSLWDRVLTFNRSERVTP